MVVEERMGLGGRVAQQFRGIAGEGLETLAQSGLAADAPAVVVLGVDDNGVRTPHGGLGAVAFIDFGDQQRTGAGGGGGRQAGNRSADQVARLVTGL